MSFILYASLSAMRIVHVHGS